MRLGIFSKRLLGRDNIVLFVMALLFITTMPVIAQNNALYNLSWYTIAGGGGMSSGGTYILNGTVGQPEAGVAINGGNYTLAGGFWGIGSVPSEPPVGNQYNVYLPLVIKDS